MLLSSRGRMTHMRSALAVAIVFHTVAATSYAQTSDGGFDKLLSPSLAATAKAMHATIRRDIAEAAEAMAIEDFAFKPTPEVRSFGQLVGHLINANFFFCSQAKGEAAPAATNFERVAEKAALIKGLIDALAYCDAVYDATTDATFNQAVTLPVFPGRIRERRESGGTVLMFNTTP